MRLKKRYKICILLLVILVISIFVRGINDVSAEIDTTYGTNYTVDSEGLNESMKNSTVLNLIGHLVYAVGRLMEWILGTIFEAITGSSGFPWADKIVFNAVPILDVNFINPNSESFIGTSGVKAAIGNTYSTIFSISLSFFTVFVMISAIKLAISTIADQKAKYKKALMDWALGLIMLFTMHYFISFIFYLNEQLVKVASDMASDAIASAGTVVQIQASETAKELIDSVKSWDSTKGTYLEQHQSIVTKWISLPSKDSGKGIHNIMKNEDISWDRAISDNDQKNNLYEAIKWVINTCPDVATLKKIRSRTFYGQVSGTSEASMLLQADYNTLKLASLKANLLPSGNADIINTATKDYSAGKSSNVCDDSHVGEDIYATKSNGDKGDWLTDTTKIEAFGITCGSPFSVVYSGTNYAGGIIKTAADNWNFYSVISDLIALKQQAVNEAALASPGGGAAPGASTSGAIITELATYFKETSFDMELRGTDITGTKDSDNVNLSNAIMYAILVAQSLILFIAYIKRLFYVVILGLISPAVVAYDFFKRFGK